MNTTAILIGAIAGCITAIIQDLETFEKARTANAQARFDWALAITRWLKGALTGALTGLSGGAIAQATGNQL